MSLNDIVKGAYGFALQLAIQDESGSVQDISSYTTITVHLRASDGTLRELSGSFLTDGTDGIVQAIVPENTIHQAGDWEIQVVLSNATQRVPTVSKSFQVQKLLS